MKRLQRTLACAVLALTAGWVSYGSAADKRTVQSAQWVEAAARQAQEAQRRQREARLRWDYQRRRSAAHARMPSTLYASTPSSQAHTDLACPVLVDDDTRRLYLDSLKGQTGSRVLRAPDLFRSGSSSKQSSSSGVRVFAAQGTGSANTAPWSSTPNDGGASHKIQASGWAAASIQPKSQTDTTHHVYLVPSASEPLRQGFVRVINHSAEAGEISIDPVDDGGRAFDTITLSVDANETIHFNSNDLETGNDGKGLNGSTGSGEGAWRLAFTSDLDIEVLSYIRTTDGFLTAMHDVAPADGDIRRVAIFNPGSNKNQVSHLRLINPTDATAVVSIRGTDDKGVPGSGEVSLSLDAGTAREITAEQLEDGSTGLEGMLGDGSGKWRLEVESEQAVVAMSLLESPTDHLTNLSTVPEELSDGVHSVPLFPAAGDDSGRQGFVRVINGSDSDGEISITAYDETERDYEPLTLTIGANEVVHFNSDDLEQGSPQKGLSGGTGAGEGDWRLALTSDLEIEVLSYIRTTDGFLTAMHDVAPSAETHHRVAVFNPGSNRNQESLLRLINPGAETAEVTITGIDDKGAAGASAVSLSLLGGGSRTVGAWDLESGGEGLEGMLGDGAGKWQLLIESGGPVVAMSLLRSPTGHLTNLSTAQVRGARGGSAHEPQTAEAVFRQLISGPIVQSKCVSCHVEGGASGNTRLVFVTDANPDHEAINLRVFEDFLGDEEDGAGYILNKIQGALGHGGGIQVPAGTDEYSNMVRFLSLLGEEVGPIAITPETLFDGVKMESARSTLRRAAIVFAGRVPTAEEYESIRTGGLLSLRTAIRNLMQGSEFHEFLTRASNDRLHTDRDMHDVIGDFDGSFPNLANERYRLSKAAHESNDEADHQQLWKWQSRVQYGFARAPLELIAHVAEHDLPYTEILTAPYIMANPVAGQAYGSATGFEDRDDVHEFKPSTIEAYYRKGDGYVEEKVPGVGNRIVDPGPLLTHYPHAGILNTTAFLKRYPTTPTNRNRARSRWTYYHFLGLDIEKSASRTTDPVALADTNNPTMNNPACTVCHTVLDPVAGVFQNYGNEGFYRDQWGGMDSLDEFYKFSPSGGMNIVVQERMRNRFDLGTVRLFANRDNELGLKNLRTIEGDIKFHLGLGEIAVRDRSGNEVDRFKVRDVAREDDCGDLIDAGYVLWDCAEMLILPITVSEDAEYTLEIEAWVLEEGEKAATLQAWMPGPFYRKGDTWYRDMRTPGFHGNSAPDPVNSVQWLAERVVGDERFAQAAVKFWWPAIMGSEVADPPSNQDGVDFEGRLLASNAQNAEVSRLARGFQRGFHDGSSFNLKDLLVEIVLSNWFRAVAVSDDDHARSEAIRTAGARRLLTPEELARKTESLTGFQWGRRWDFWAPPPDEHAGALTRGWEYELLYGGIDSDGITERARDITSVMAGVARSHAAGVSCPVVLRDFYLLPDTERWLFGGIDLSVYPTLEYSDTREVRASTYTESATVSVSGRLRAGAQSVSIFFVNDFKNEETGDDRNVWLDRLDVVDEDGQVVVRQELEELDGVNCSGPTGDHYKLACSDRLTVPISVPVEGRYDIQVLAWAEQVGDELAMVEIAIESDSEHSAGAKAIRDKLAELHDRLLGVDVGPYSDDVEAAYGLFVEVWERKRRLENSDFFHPSACDAASDHAFFDGILDHAIVERINEEGDVYHAVDWERVNDFIHGTVKPNDHNGVARTWVVVLAYLMMDYRYLYL